MQKKLNLPSDIHNLSHIHQVRLKQLRNYKQELIFVSATEIGRSTPNILNCYFSKKKLHFRTAEQMPIYEKLNLLLIKTIYLVSSSRERQRRLTQTKVYYKLLCSVRKELSHKPLKVTAAKRSFPSMYIIDKTCFD